VTVLPDAPPVLGPVARPPQRRPGSVRRTSTILMTWPGGITGGLHLTGRCRDARTAASHGPTDDQPRPPLQVLAQKDMIAVAGMDPTVRAVSSPGRAGLDGLVGSRAGGALRADLDEVVPDLKRSGAPLYLLLDDLAGTSLIAGFVWSRWRNEMPDHAELGKGIPVRSMQGICSGFPPGASSLNPDGTQSGIAHVVQRVPPLIDPADPEGWHALDPPPPMAMRRARRIDVWCDPAEQGSVQIDAMFRDSCWEPDGSEVAVHEYHLTATARNGVLTSLIAEPRILPFAECPYAAANVGVLVGAPLEDFRVEVLERLKATECCTHLNDALRALAEVPALTASLPTD